MRVDNALLLAAAFMTSSPVSVIAKYNAAHGRAAPPYAILNTTFPSTQSTISTSLSTTSLVPSPDGSSNSASPVQISLSTTSTSTSTSTETTSSQPPSSHTPPTTSRSTTRYHTIHSHNSTTPVFTSQNPTTPVLSLNTTSPTSFSTTTHRNATSAPKPTPTPHLPPGYTYTAVPCTSTINGTVNGTANGSSCRNGTMISIIPACTPLPSSKTFTQFLIVHTSTVTFMGNRSDYRPPYETISTPNYCDPNIYPQIPSPALDKTWSFAASSSMTTETFTLEGLPVTGVFPVVTETEVVHAPVMTFITTDKNPAVVFPSGPIPNYRQTFGDGSNNGNGNGNNGYKTPVDDNPAPVLSAPTYTITAAPSSVIINAQMFTVAPGSSSTVTLQDGAVFTIGPNDVVGQGTSITRPPPSGKTPSSSILDGIPVTSAGPDIQIGGGTFAIPSSAANTVHVNGKAVTINPEGITIGGNSMSFARPAPSDIVVAGGEMLTAIGPSVVVLHSVTYTYGAGISPVVQAINGDTVSIEPTGVIVHGSTLGGVSAKATETEYEIVGGATIAKIPPSMVIVNGVTYAVGPGANTRTVVIGDQTLTLGPIGVVMASTTMKFPFDTEVTATVAGLTSQPMPKKTGTDEKDAAHSLRPDVRVGLTCVCIVFGVLVLG